ncbi:MAG: FolC bifunctional protein, partial [Edaphobacter sp.]|nr:FolC bifunctional protein [Edaphobacter sp.]
QRNIALAVAAASELRNQNSYKSSQTGATGNYASYKIANRAIEEGIRNTTWPGRLELIAFSEGPSLLLDVAHNPAGAWALRAAIAQLPDARPRTLIFSCLRDKNLREMSQILFPLFDSSSAERSKDHILFAPIDNPRAAGLEELLAAAQALDIPAHAAAHPAAAVARARIVTPPEGLIIATGSVYLVGEVRHLAVQE